MDANINSVLESKEKIVWQDVVSRKVLVFFLIISLIVTFVIGGLLLSKETINYTSNGQPRQIRGVAVGMVILGIGLAISLLKFFQDWVKNYALTQKRVIIKSGIIGTDFKSIYFDQIREAIVDVGLIDKIFGVGTIKIDTGKTETYSTGGHGRARGIGFGNIRTRTMYTSLKHINNPYEVYKYLQQTLEGRKESLYSGRADREAHPESYP